MHLESKPSPRQTVGTECDVLERNMTMEIADVDAMGIPRGRKEMNEGIFVWAKECQQPPFKKLKSQSD